MTKQFALLAVLVTCLTCNLQTRAIAQEITEQDVVLECLPEDVIATMEARDQLLTALPQDTGVLQFLVEDPLRWEPGSTVRVAFLGGDSALHKKIAEAAESINKSCNIKLDFGHNSATGSYRTWSTSDTNYTAEIRVSFDQAGNFSLVGNDSINPNIGSPFGPVGGRPNQRSLNLSRFDIQLPPYWARTARHELLHALAFHHEHQSPLGGCDSHFRWENDPGYVPTRDSQGRFQNDPQGRRPGIYTYLSGYPNFWNRAKVDHNLRQRPTLPGYTVGAFDRASIMLYRFPELFYVSHPSPCAPAGDGEELSPGDIAGLRHLYPHKPDIVKRILWQRTQFIHSVNESKLANLKKLEILQSVEGVQD